MNMDKRKLRLLLQSIEYYKGELEKAKEAGFKYLERFYSEMICLYEEELEEIKGK